MALVASRLEYAHAFDLMAERLANCRGAVLVIVSTPEFVDLTLARAWYAWSGVTFLCEDIPTLAHAERRLAEGYLSESTRTHSRALLVRDAHLASEPFLRGLWASPIRSTWPERLAIMEHLLQPTGRLCVLAATPVGALLRPLRRARAVGDPVRLPRQLGERLGSADWRTTEVLGIGSAASAGWAVAARIVAALGRPDLADRAEHAHHRAVARAEAASYVILTAERAGSATSLVGP